MIGIDEVGRGAWAGPLVVAGCYFSENPSWIKDLNDSKLLTKSSREILEPAILSSSVYRIISVAPSFIDSEGLTACLRWAILEILKTMPKTAEIILDGKYNFLKGTLHETRTRIEVKADSKYEAVMAASIIAKVERDRIMQDYDKQYPGYGFATNVGYGTLVHRVALKEQGVTPLHRKSYKPVREYL